MVDFNNGYPRQPETNPTRYCHITEGHGIARNSLVDPASGQPLNPSNSQPSDFPEGKETVVTPHSNALNEQRARTQGWLESANY